MSYGNSGWEDFIMNCFEKVMLYFLMPVFLIAIIALPVGLIWAGCSESKPFVCSHQPHMGACQVMVTTYYYNAATKTMMPIQSPCGCTSNHGAVVLTQ